MAEFEFKCVPYEEGKLPPRNHVLVQIKSPQGVIKVWADPKDLPKPTKEKRSTLTPEQRAQSHAIFDVIRGYVTHVPDEKAWDDGFEIDTDPSWELTKWARLAKVFVDECALRPADQRPLLFRALVTAISGMQTVDAMLSLDPKLKSLPNLQRVVDAMELEARRQGVDT